MTVYRRILCPVDFSEATDAGLAAARRLAAATAAEVVLLHAVDFPHESVATERFYLEVEDAARERMADLADGFEEGTKTAVEVRRGDAREAILEAASEEGMDAIVMPGHGRAGLDRLLHGSVATQVVRTAPCPVLVVPPGAELGGPILFATDFSEHAQRALGHAVALARALGERLVIMHVATLVEDGVQDWRFPALTQEMVDAVLEEAEAELAATVEQAGEEALEVTARLVRGTYAATEIVETAASLEAGILVVGSHGRTGLARAVLGSVAEKVLRASPVPVLVVRHDRAD